MPLIVGFTACRIAWSTGLARFKAPILPGAVLGMHFASAGSGFVSFCQCLGVMLVLGALENCKYAAGEEIGWRGYMLTRLVHSGIRVPVLVSGLAWGYGTHL